MSALNEQVGGSHYKDFAIQPIEFIQKNSIGFIPGNVIKYVCRYKAKGGVEDLKKARHYLDILIEMREKEDKRPAPENQPEKNCGNCKHSLTSLTDPPCNACIESRGGVKWITNSEWEPAQKQTRTSTDKAVHTPPVLDFYILSHR